MQRARRGFLALGAFLCCAAASPGGVNSWTSLGPEGGDVLAIAIDPVDPQVAYAGTYSGGVYKTTDGGETWIRTAPLMFTATIEAKWITSVAIDPSDPSNVYVGAQSSLFKSEDGGATWSLRTSPDYGFLWLLKVDPGAPSRLYAGTDYGFHRSEDDGATWKPLSPFSDNVFLSLGTDPSDRDTLYLGSYFDHVRKSTDGGTTWTDVPVYSVYSLALDPANPGTVYFGSYGQGMWKTTNGGATVFEIDDGIDTRLIVSVAVDPSGKVYAATDGGGVYRSADSGAHWAPSNAGLPNDFLETLALDPADPSRLIAGLQGSGVFRTDDSAATWVSKNAGLRAAPIEQIAIHPSNPDRLLAAVHGAGVARSTDLGAHWSFGSSGPAYPDFRGMSLDPSNADVLYAAESGALVKSVDAGAHWADVSPANYRDFRATAVSVADPEVLYASAYKRLESSVFRSSDGGGAWDPINAGMPDEDYGPPTVAAITPSPIEPSFVLAASDEGAFRTRDGGDLWERIPELTGIGASRFAFDPVDERNIFAGGNRLFRSRDGGTSWTAIPAEDSYGISSISVDPSDPTRIYATTYYGYVLKSVDGGRSWDPLAKNPDVDDITSFAFDPTDSAHIFAGVYGAGVFDMHQTGPGVDGASPESGAPGGGAAVTIHGSGFRAGASVRFGVTPATDALVLDDQTVRATAPALPTGFEDVLVVNPDGQAGIARAAWFADFEDVGQSHPLHDAIVRIARAGITTGCGTGGFCPDAAVTRAQMAIFLLRAEHGSPYHPPAATGAVFGDVPRSGFAAPWIEELAAEGITKGCGGGNFCPTLTLTRGEIAVFLVRTVHGAGFFPPDPVGIFTDVPTSHPFARWIEQLAADGITSGCGGGRFCPSDVVTRAHMAGFLSRAFHLP